jgi:hypothetical protein
MQFHEGLAIRDTPDESNHSPVRMQNACGFAITSNRHPRHPAWQMQPCIFGRVRKAYTAAGNVIQRGNKIIFKGATTPQPLEDVMSTLVDEKVTAQLQLVVLSVGIGRCLFVMLGCLLERRLAYVPWARVMHRIEEVCSVVVFYVTDWRAMEEALQMQPWAQPPKTTTVSVTRRGTLTLRLTWDAADWADNDALYDVTRRIGEFARDLV